MLGGAWWAWWVWWVEEVGGGTARVAGWPGGRGWKWGLAFSFDFYLEQNVVQIERLLAAPAAARAVAAWVMGGAAGHGMVRCGEVR